MSTLTFGMRFKSFRIKLIVQNIVIFAILDYMAHSNINLCKFYAEKIVVSGDLIIQRIMIDNLIQPNLYFLQGLYY
jgi:hypothetical protein